MMKSYQVRICCGILAVLLLRSIGANEQQIPQMPLQCYIGSNSNETLDNTIHLSDVVLAGRIISLKEGEFGTHSAVVSYYYAYKSDGLLRRRALSRVKVSNFVSVKPPAVGKLGMFFLFREPNMQLSLFCMSLINMLIENDNEEEYEQIVRHINEVGTNDTIESLKFVPSYPSNCNSGLHPCSGSGAYCNEINTLPQENIRCSCLTGFYRNDSSMSCISRTKEGSDLHCSECTHNARCSASDNSRPPARRNCICSHIDCSSTYVEPVCGSDGHTYKGECWMRLEACRLQRDIYKLYDGACTPEVVKPCMDIGLPLTTSSGLVQCLYYDSCPTKHFCHSTSHYKVCCPVLLPTTTSTTSTATLPLPSLIITPTLSPRPKPTPISCSGSGSGSGSGDDIDNDSGGFPGTMNDDEDWNRRC